MVSVIIPTLNEERTIRRVVEFALSSEYVSEVIVVDDKSVDKTIEEAKKAGARIIYSTKIGKGASMRDGILVAENEIVVFLDADVEDYRSDTISRMAEPVMNDEVDFVKASFEREAGRVTELVAKPLISLLFPEAHDFEQPLSGMIAARKNFLEKVSFEDGYGVDVGILLDMLHAGARIKEINIGYIQHKSKPWQQLSIMSREVSEAILKRASKKANLNLQLLETVNIIQDQLEFALKRTLIGLPKMLILGIDNILIKEKIPRVLAEKFGFKTDLNDIDGSGEDEIVKLKMIANRLKGVSVADIIKAVDDIPVRRNVADTIRKIKSRGYIVGILSEGFDVVTQHFKVKVDADFALSNELEFSQSIATGEVKIPSFFIKSENSLCAHNYCKTHAVARLAEQYNVGIRNLMVIGNTARDICMVRNSGASIAFNSKNNILNAISDEAIRGGKFRDILLYAL